MPTDPANELTPDEKREDQLTAAPKATDADAKPRIAVEEAEPGVTRIDIRDDAYARPGKPDSERA
ncbi:hypothetical protein GCM10027406_13610 [Leifsonia lichenia]